MNVGSIKQNKKNLFKYLKVVVVNPFISIFSMRMTDDNIYYSPFTLMGAGRARQSTCPQYLVVNQLLNI